MTLALVALLAVVVAAVFGHEMPHDNGPGFLLDESRDSTFAIPVEVGVGLIGFSGDGAGAVQFAADELAMTLQNSLPALRPNCLQTGDPLSVQYKIDYAVRNFPTTAVHALETALQYAMKFVGTIEGVLTYDVEATDIAKTLDTIYSLEFGRDERSSGNARTGPAVTKTPYAILILNPSKTAMRPAHASSTAAFKALPFQYRYRYAGGAPTQAWVSEHRYLVVDLSAGPAEYGVTDSGEGTVSVGTIPLLATRKGVPTAVTEFDPVTGKQKSKAQIEHEKSQPTTLLTIQFQAQLASVVVSAVRHVFVTDVRFSHLEYSEKLIVPIIVFRNHKRFDPFAPRAAAGASASASASTSASASAPGAVASGDAADEFFIDTAVIRSELKKMLLPHQELLLVTGVHSLYDHQHVSTSVFKSIRADTIHSVGSDGVYRAKVVPHIDSAVLEDEMRHAADSLTAALLHSNGLSHHAPVVPPLAHGAHATASSSHGHRVLPVYVFSLLGLDKSLLFDHRHVHVASGSAVMVLQTGSNAIPLPFFSQNGIVHANARAPTRHIVAGLTTALGGVMNPFERFSAETGSVVNDYLWANGHHPFGPFANTARVSDLFVDVALRNSIISRVEHSLQAVRRAVALVDAFTDEYVRDPYGAALHYEDSDFDSVLEFWSSKQQSAQSPLAAATVSRLEQQLTALSGSFEQLAQHFQAYALDDANTLSGSIVVASRAFAQYAADEIANARVALKCCAKEHRVSTTTASNRLPIWTYLFVLFMAVCAAFSLYEFLTPQRHRRATSQAAKPIAYRFTGTSVGTPTTAFGSDDGGRAHRY